MYSELITSLWKAQENKMTVGVQRKFINNNNNYRFVAPTQFERIGNHFLSILKKYYNNNGEHQLLDKTSVKIFTEIFYK